MPINSLNEFVHERTDAQPVIYAYSDTRYPGCLKVGYTSRTVEQRMREHYPTVTPKKSYSVELVETAMKPDGTVFLDHAVHAALENAGFECEAGEWYKCSVKEVRAAVLAVRKGVDNSERRTNSFALRPEQQAAIDKTIAFYNSAKAEYPDRAPKFLWNAKMRFGKTFASYQLARKMGLKKILILTFKPAVEAAWEEDLKTHIDFEGWQFICRGGLTYEQADKSRPIVCFGSFQDFLGTNESGGIKAKNEWVHTTNWDMVIFDEYHFGAWRDNAKKLFDAEDEDNYDSLDLEKYKREEADNAYNETFLPITTQYYLFLSGTPFRAINSGEFIEDQIYNWTYSDEQKAKASWSEKTENPYAALPKMIMMTYTIPESIRSIAMQGEFNEFDLNVFFSAKGTGDSAKFVYEEYVQKWLDLIRGAHLPSSIDDMKLGKDKKPPMPYSDATLLNVLSHTLWFLPNVAACYAMKNLLSQRQNVFYHDYTINVCAGTSAGIGVNALAPVRKSMSDPLNTKTITLSCGKLTTGITVKPWTGIFMLRNLKSPETYFQAAFRVQSPWEITVDGYKKEIVKHECYVFDFALDRALRQISDYSCRLNVNENDPEKKVGEFISFLPVLAYDGSTMKQISAADILDIAMSGTSATLLAKRWESALLVNVDNETLARLMASKEAMEALQKIEGFRSLNADIERIINKSEAVKKAKKEGGDKLTEKQKKELSAEEKEYKSKRKMIQEKLIKFATRIPIFMYLSEYREKSLRDVIELLEPELFRKTTGLDVKDFELLVSLNVFNGPIMNDAIYKFKRYEDSSLTYTGIDMHEGEDVGGWDSVLTRDEYEQLYYNQQATLVSIEIPDKISDNITVFVEKPVSEVKKPAEKKAAEIPVKKSAPAAKEEKKEAQPTVDISGVSVGTKVRHKIFGEGVVTEIKDNLAAVKFGAGEKRFVLDTVFEQGFLMII